MEFYIVDAFSERLFCGNPAGVVLLGEAEAFPDEEAMRRVAAELRYSETAFVRRLSAGQYHTRYFTPVAEVDLCGHATVAAFHVLAENGLLQGPCLNRTGAGNLRIEVDNGIIFMEMGAPEYHGTIDDPDAQQALYAAMGLPHAAPSPFPVECISTGLPDILLPVSDEDELAAIAPDFDALAALSEQYDVVGVHAFTVQAADGRIHCRNFAPRYGINEEAATGTASGALTWYLHRRGMSGSGETSFVQGEAMVRPSVIHSRMETAPDGKASIQIGGNAVILASGTLRL